MGDNSIVGAVVAASANLCISDSIPGTGSNTWIIDIGASDHITYDAKFFDELSSNTRDPYITSANGLPYPITMSTQFHAQVKVFRSDNGGEYVNNTLASFFRAQGIIHQKTTLFAPQQNDTVLGKKTTCLTEASDRSPISEDETCGLCEEATDRHFELDRSPISGNEAGALDIEMTGHTEASDQSPVSENNDNDFCMDEFDAIPPCPSSAPIYS
ncbi:hypothetical protein L3X38_030255 [Prunus dulcis]|uniref:Integrase catalytic domain-containing protein n=1 Tax=Prunus dulcis TaxID=3755 RepID=A0AAD4VB35_PRUDU|nr:hypothetical protein L3X38_030255 [Prunus dulcis]